MSRVIGIDTNSYGFHWVSTKPVYDDDDFAQKYGWVACKDDNPDVRRGEMLNYSHGLFQSLSLNPTPNDDTWHVFCEEPLALQNGKTTRLLGLAAGAIWAGFYLAKPNAYWHWVDQSTWKKNVLGRGRRPNDFEYRIKSKAEKEWIIEQVRKLPGFQADFNDPITAEDFDKQADLYDAYALRTYGVRTVPSL